MSFSVSGVRIFCRRRAHMLLVAAMVCPLFAGQAFGDPRSAVPFAEARHATGEAADLESECFRFINMERQKNGLAPLALDEALSAIARGHSQDMAALGLIAHETPTGGTLQERLRRAGYSYQIARENVARAPTLHQAEAGLLSSTPHLKNLLATDVTHAGIGIVLGGDSRAPGIYLTQVLARPQPPPRTSEIQAVYQDRIAELRKNRGLGPLRIDPFLECFATHSLQQIGLPLTRERLERYFSAAAQDLRSLLSTEVGRLTIDVQMLAQPSSLRLNDCLQQTRARLLGAAVLEVKDPHGRPRVALLSIIGLAGD